MQIIKCWDIQVWDGADRTNHKYYVASKEAADEWKSKNRFDYVTKCEFIVFDTLEELAEYDTDELRKRAMSKLTAAEKKALGL